MFQEKPIRVACLPLVSAYAEQTQRKTNQRMATQAQGHDCMHWQTCLSTSTAFFLATLAGLRIARTTTGEDAVASSIFETLNSRRGSRGLAALAVTTVLICQYTQQHTESASTRSEPEPQTQDDRKRSRRQGHVGCYRAAAAERRHPREVSDRRRLHRPRPLHRKPQTTTTRMRSNSG